jgi:hypothetical protein
MARGTTTLLSVESLFSLGLETDATASARTLAELLIDLCWIWKEETPQRVCLFVEYIYVINHRRDDMIQRWATRYGTTPNKEKAFEKVRTALPDVASADEYLALQEADYQRVRQNYPKSSQWAPKDLRSRATEVGYEDVYDWVFRLGSEASHSGAATIASLANIAGMDLSIQYEPQVPRSNEPLMAAAICYIDLIEFGAACLEAHPPLGLAELKAQLSGAFQAG